MARPTDGIAQIVKKDGEHVGMAILLDRSHVLTCAHVVNQALGRDNHFDERRPTKDDALNVLVHFPSLQDRSGNVVHWGLGSDGQDVDLAVVELDAPCSAPAATFSEADCAGRSWTVYGQHANEKSAHWTREDGANVSHEVRDQRVELHGVIGAGRWIEKGDSGAAVWCGSVGAAIGIVTTKHRESAANRISQMLPAAVLNRFLAKFRESSAPEGSGGPCVADPAACLRQMIGTSLWCQEIQGLNAWSEIQGASSQLADRVQVIVLRAHTLVTDALAKVPDDRWRDVAAPSRVCRQLEMLLDERQHKLSPAEAALALVVPYVYEAILAAGALLLVQDRDPPEPSARAYASIGHRARLALQDSLSSAELLERRGAVLKRRNLLEAGQDLANWLTTRFLHSSGELWEYVPGATDDQGCWLNREMDELFAPSPLSSPSDSRAEQLLGGRRVVQLARLLFADPEEIEFARARDYPNRLQDDLRVGAGPHEWRASEGALAHLLCLAAAMAADPRRLDPVLAEHLGMSREITALELKRAFSSVVWYREQHGLVMSLSPCPHEAIDLSIERLTASLAAHRHKLDTTITIDERFRSALPQHFSDRRVEAALDGRTPRYRRPHLQLALDQHRMLHLLMGRSLYGKPEMALRELYQNALDACRLRRARVRYLRASDGGVDDYAGRIVFKAGTEQGRAFIECVDNGIGMAERHLRSFFARAGYRFTDSHEFHVERAAWRAKNVRFFANSRFGIGVFSYFMLADEVLIQSKRLRANGQDWEPGVRARIVGGSSLFRVQPAHEVLGGTLVRLYLSESREIDELLNSILDWLWIPEFDTVLVGPSGVTTHLPAGAPSPSFVQTIGKGVPAQQSADSNGHPRLFWHANLGLPAWKGGDGGSVLLADGILTANSSKVSASWLVVNLNEDLRPELNVDRSQVITWATGFGYVTNLLREGAWQDILKIPDLDLLRLEDAFAGWMLPLFLMDREWRARALSNLLPDIPRTRDRGGEATLLRRLAPSRLGLAPFLDRVIFGVIRREPPGLQTSADLFDGGHHRSLSQWVAARVLALRGASTVVLPRPLLMLAEFASRKGWRDHASLGLALLSSNLDGKGPWLESVSIAHLLKASWLWSFTLGEVAEIARPLAMLGVPLPDLDRFPRDFRLSDVHHRLLRDTFKGSTSPRDSISLGSLLEAETDLSLPLRELMKLIQPLADLGLATPSPRQVPPTSELTEQHRVLISDGFNGRSPWLTAIPLHHILMATKWLSLSLPDAIKLALHLANFGVAVPDFGDFLEDELQQSLLSSNLDRRSPWSTWLTVPHLIAAAARLSVSLAEIGSTAHKLVRLGVRCPDLDRLSQDLPLDPRLVALLGSFKLPLDFSLESLLQAAAGSSTRLRDVVDLVQPLATLGVPVANLPDGAGDFIPTDKHLQLLSADLDGERIHAGSVSLERLLAASVEWRLTIGEVADIARPLAGANVVMPDLDRLPRDFRPTKRHARLLSVKLNGEAPWLDALTLGHALWAPSVLKVSLRQVVASCRSLAELGLEVPPALSRVEDTPQPELLIELLSRDLDGEAPWMASVSLSHVFKACVKWSRSVGELIDLLRPFEILDFDDCPAELRDFRPGGRHEQLMHENLKTRNQGLRHLGLGHLMLAAVEWALSLKDVVDMARPMARLGLVTMFDLDRGLSEFAVSERYLILLSQDLDGWSPWVEAIAPHHLRSAAGRFSWPLSRMIGMVRRLGEIGFSTPPFPALSVEVERRAMELIDCLRPGQRSLAEWEIAALARAHGVDIAEYAPALPMLVAVGVDVSDVSEFLRFCAADASHSTFQGAASDEEGAAS